MIKKFILNKKNKKVILNEIDKINKIDYHIPQYVIDIIEDVKKNKDKAVKKYEKKFDGVDIKNLKVEEETIKNAYKLIDKNLIYAIKIAKKNIEKFHILQKKNINGYLYKNLGYTIEQRYIPIESVGIYIPGGQSPLFSTVLMATIPAIIAGVKDINLVSPPKYNGEINPYILVTADLLGVKNIFRVGGVQAIAALAFGTETIPKVDKIVGPGNIYSTLAKKYLFGVVGIESISGPSEIAILADKDANVNYILYDLLAQAEHINGHSLLITNSKSIAKFVEDKLREEGVNDINILIIMVENIEDGVEIINYKAPEHLSILTKNPYKILKKIKNSPAIFIGDYTPVAFGDYIAGANHILPTNGTGRFFSALSILDFLKHIHIVKCSKEAIKKFGVYAEKMAEKEDMKYHSKSIYIRRTNNND